MDFLGIASLAGSLAPWVLLALAVWWALHQVRARQSAEIEVVVQRRRAETLMQVIASEKTSRAQLAADLARIEAERKKWQEGQNANKPYQPGDRISFGGPLGKRQVK